MSPPVFVSYPRPWRCTCGPGHALALHDLDGCCEKTAGEPCACKSPEPWLVAWCWTCGWSGPLSEAHGYEGNGVPECPTCRVTALHPTPRPEPTSAAARTLPLPFPQEVL